jgi:hypothetical protein
MADDDVPILDSWTERTSDDLWVLGGEVEQATPVDMEFAPWHEGDFTRDDSHKNGYHGWTNGSRRTSAGFG